MEYDPGFTPRGRARPQVRYRWTRLGPPASILRWSSCPSPTDEVRREREGGPTGWVRWLAGDGNGSDEIRHPRPTWAFDASANL